MSVLRRCAAAALAAAAVILFTPPAPAQAQEDDAPARLELGGDLYVAGSAPRLEGDVEDVFAAGETLRSDLAVSGSAHLAGRRVSVRGPVSGNLYAAGQDVRVEAEIAGDATLAGYDVTVGAPVQGDLRAGASSLVIEAPVAGALLAAAERVVIDSEIAGDARIWASEVRYGPDARIGGELILTAPEEAAPPPSAAPDDRVERRAPTEWPVAERGAGEAIWGAISFFLGSALLLLAVQALFVGLAPRWSEDVAFDAHERPFRSLGGGFLALAALIGSIPLLLATVIGAPLIPLAALAVGLAVLAGYALGAWTLGAAVWRGLDRTPPLRFGARFGVAALGLAIAALLGLIPFLGWLVAVVLTLGGLGAAALELAGRRSRPAG